MRWDTKASSDVNTMLDGSTSPKWKMGCLNQLNFFTVKTQQAIIGTIAAANKLTEPYSVHEIICPSSWEWIPAMKSKITAPVLKRVATTSIVG